MNEASKTPKKKPLPADSEDIALRKVQRELDKLSLSDSAKSRVLDTLQRRYRERVANVAHPSATASIQ